MVVPWVEGRVVTTEMPLVAEEMIMMVPGTIVTAVMAAVEILVVMAEIVNEVLAVVIASVDLLVTVEIALSVTVDAEAMVVAEIMKVAEVAETLSQEVVPVVVAAMTLVGGLVKRVVMLHLEDGNQCQQGEREIKFCNILVKFYCAIEADFYNNLKLLGSLKFRLICSFHQR